MGSEDVEEIKAELLEVLAACCEILSDLQDHVSKIRTGADNIGVMGSLQLIWDEDVIGDATRTLHQQEVAILLILEILGRLNFSIQSSHRAKFMNRTEKSQ